MKKLINAPFSAAKCLFCLVVLFFSSFSLSAQTVSGKVNDANGQPLAGATVIVKGTTNGTTTDNDGSFSLNNVAKGSTLLVSFVGFGAQEISADGGNINVSLKESDALNELVVTGVFDPRTRMQASVAISTLNSVQLDRIVPTSSVDLLKNLPGTSMGFALNTGRIAAENAAKLF